MTVDEFKSFRHAVTPPGNRKIRNARKIERDGVKFDSRLEMYMYDLLTMAGIRFEFQKRYCVQEGFRYRGAAIRPVTYTVDFFLPEHDTVIDTKGYRTQQGDLRIKMLKRLLSGGEFPHG
ncbi:MAG: DUF1064 domain-containing protein [Alistipes indistinctus]